MNDFVRAIWQEIARGAQEITSLQNELAAQKQWREQVEPNITRLIALVQNDPESAKGGSIFPILESVLARLRQENKDMATALAKAALGE